jgi:NAD-dependent DNA ligase
MVHTLTKLGVEGISKTTAKKLVEAGLKTFEAVYKAPIGGLQTVIGPGNGQKLRTALDTLAVPESAWIESYCGWPKGFGSTRITATLAVEPTISSWPTLTKPPKGQSTTSFAEVQACVPAYLKWRGAFKVAGVVADTKPSPAVSKGTYVMTGFRDAGLQAQLAEHGWTLQDRVTKTTTVLLVADDAKETTKVKSARDAGVRIVLRSQAQSLL